MEGLSVDWVLLVDDDEIHNFIHHKVLKKYLAEETIQIAYNGAQAILLLDSKVQEGLHHKRGVIFLDINMPVMNGFQFISEFNLKYAELFPNTRILPLSSSDHMDDVIQMTGFNAGRGSRRDGDDDETAGMDSDVAAAIQSIGMRINYDLITQTVKEIDAELSYLKQDGGILIFLPGVVEINRTLDYLRSIPNLHALPLHASLQSLEQRRVFPHAPTGKRKVIVATNVAETSITIDDIVAVIDTGRVKETSYDPQNNMRKLEEVWASRAACKQRRGRAGRVRAGKCYKLYTRNAEMSKMAERPEPEIRRVPLEQLCLSVRAMGIKEVGGFLASALTPPESLAVDGAMDLLGRMGALDGDDLTALGRHLSMIPADLRCGKLMVYGAMFGCLDACVAIAAILTVKSPFVSPQDKREEAKSARAKFAKNQGDLIGDLKAFEQWNDMVSNRR